LAESLLRKVERQVLDLDKSYTINKFNIFLMEAGNKSQTQEPIERYIFNFKWDDTNSQETILET